MRLFYVLAVIGNSLADGGLAFNVPDAIRNIVTTVVTGGVSMVIIFAIDKYIFSPGFGQKKEEKI